MNLLLKVSLVFLLLFIVHPQSMKSQSVFPEELKKAFITGNSEEVAACFGKNIELILFDKGDVYTREQAQLIIQDFFSKYKIRSFTIESENFDENTKYAVALLKTGRKSFRVFIAYRKNFKKTLISQLVISELEKDNE